MIFSSLGFLLFFSVVYPAYWAIRGRKAKLAFLLAASCFFYMASSAGLVALMLATIIFDYYLARRMVRETERAKRRPWLALSIVSNLAILAIFKYADFFVQAGASAARLCGASVYLPHLDIILPVGVSFYTFQSMSYTIDVYGGRLKPADSLLDFTALVTFFPHMVAGPILRARDMLPQIETLPRFTWEDFSRGADLFMLGVLKKCFVADRLSLFVDAIFSAPGKWDAASTWCGVVAYAYQIYCDFSGYTDMARGLARMFGIDFQLNFRTPYLSRDVSEFWTRWHISLSTWLRDYLFTPLGGYREGRLLGYRNLFLTMLLGGLWHGANWTFVIWGAYHGVLLVLRRVFDLDDRRAGALRASVDRLWTFGLVCVGWVFFRSQNVFEAAALLKSMFGAGAGRGHMISHYALALIALMACYDAAEYWAERRKVDVGGRALSLAPLLRGAAYAAAIVGVLLFAPRDLKPFIYFQF